MVGVGCFFRLILFTKNYVDDLCCSDSVTLGWGVSSFVNFLGVDFWNFDLFSYGVKILIYFYLKSMRYSAALIMINCFKSPKWPKHRIPFHGQFRPAPFCTKKFLDLFIITKPNFSTIFQSTFIQHFHHITYRKSQRKGKEFSHKKTTLIWKSQNTNKPNTVFTQQPEYINNITQITNIFTNQITNQ